jgi:small subunit ribosomal protein S3
MGQKVHPGGLRVGVIHDWKSNWMVSSKEFAGALLEDLKIREHIIKKLSHAGLSDILIRKDKQRITIDIYTARPGIVIGKSGVEVDALRKEVHALTRKNVHININEIKRPELDAKLVAQSIAEQLQNRVSFRRAMKRSLASAIRSGAAGVKVQCSGRLGGSEMSRSEQYSEGRVPLHTIRADIDYGFTEARTPTGRIGVKVWINKGEIMPAGYGGVPGGGKETRLGDQDTARRRGGVTEGLGASREAGRGRSQDREGLGPVRRSRPGQRGGRPGGGPRRDAARREQAPESVEQPVVEEVVVEQPAPAEAQPVVEDAVVEEAAAPVVEAPVAVEEQAPAKEAAPPRPRRSRKVEPAAVPEPAAEEAPAAVEEIAEAPSAPAPEPEPAAEEDTGYETVVFTAVKPPVDDEKPAEPAQDEPAETEDEA